MTRRRGTASLTSVLVAVGVAALFAGCVADDAAPSDRSPSPPSTSPPATAPGCDAQCYSDAEPAGSLAAGVAVEVSGMAASRRTPGAYYVVSDEPGTSQVAAVRADGTLIAQVPIADMDARNAEALEVGPCGDAPDETCLYVADIGDHVGREDVVVHRVPEPDLTTPPTEPVPSDVLRFTYADEPTDAEALIVDDTGRPFVVTKATVDEESGRTGPTRLYRGRADGGVLEPVATIQVPEPADGVLAGLVGNAVTGASAAPGRVLLRTYDQILEYRAADPSADLSTFPRWSRRRVPAGALIQAEAVTYRSAGCGYLTASELTGQVAAVSCVGNSSQHP